MLQCWWNAHALRRVASPEKHRHHPGSPRWVESIAPRRKAVLRDHSPARLASGSALAYHGTGRKRAVRLYPSFAKFALYLTLMASQTNPSSAQSDANFYNRKQIRLIVSTDAGGAYATYARLMAQVLKDHIPGNPNIIIQNMPGASGLKTANYMYASAPRDGTVIASTHASILTTQLTSPGAATFESTKFSWIGSITTDPFVGYVWHTVPIRTLDDTRKTEVIMGGEGVGASSVDYAIMAR